MPTDTAKLSSDQSLESLACAIRAALDAARVAHCNALQCQLDVGDALLQAQAQVTTGWTKWLRENCALSERSGFLYMRLAKHRVEIEAEIERIGELSLRAALRLVGAPGTKKSKPKPPGLLLAWSTATAEERTLLFDTVGMLEFLRTISFAFRRELESRLRKQKAENPDFHLTAAFRVAMGHLRIADNPETSRPVAQSQEAAALNAMRGLARLYAEFNDLSIGFQEPVRPRRGRAA